MKKIAGVPDVDPRDDYPNSCRDTSLEINPPSSAAKVPASDSDGAADGKPVFAPNPDLVLP